MNEWTMQEAGWWTSPLGAVCKEANGQWECYIDGEGYPPAFLKVGRLRLEFTRAGRKVDHVAADVRIYLDPEGGAA